MLIFSGIQGENALNEKMHNPQKSFSLETFNDSR